MEIVLAPLTRSESDAIVADVGKGADVDLDLAWELGGGNPFFALEVAAALSTNGDPGRSACPWTCSTRRSDPTWPPSLSTPTCVSPSHTSMAACRPPRWCRSPRTCRGDPVPALASGAGALFYALGAAGARFSTGLGRRAWMPGPVRALVDVGSMANAFARLPGAIAVGAIAWLILTRHILPEWTGWVGVLTATGLLVGLFSLAGRSDFFSPGGVYAGALTIVLVVAWVLVTSVALLLPRAT